MCHRRQPLPKMASPPATQVPPKVPEKEERVTPPIQREQREKTKTAAAATKESREKKVAPVAVLKTKEKEREPEKERRVQPQQEKVEKRTAAAERSKEKKALERKEKEKPERPPKSKPVKVKAEPPPKKRKKWLKEIPSSSDSDSSEEAASENESKMLFFNLFVICADILLSEVILMKFAFKDDKAVLILPWDTDLYSFKLFPFIHPVPVKGGVNNRAMREMFRSYVEMLVSTALDPDMIQALEDTAGENIINKALIKTYLNVGSRRIMAKSACKKKIF